MRGKVKVSGVLVAAIVITQASAALAAESAEQVCAEVAKKAGKTLWASVRESGDAMFCRKSWVPGTPDELMGCGTWTLTNKWANKLKGLWNNIFSDKEWATWGARGISVDWEEGQIDAGFKRTFFGAGLAASKTTVEVVKEGGQAAATITTCELDYEGRVTAKQQKSFAGGKGGEGTVVKIELSHTDNRILGVVVDTANPIGVTFEYRARTISQPIRTDYGAVDGIADLHVHQMVNITFGGRMYWGHHSGPPETALAKEEVNPFGTGYDLTTLEGLYKQMKENPKFSLDANVAFKIAGGKISDEGFWKYGGEGFPTYKDWPHHADRSHQAAHISWVKEAHVRGSDTKPKESNLQLMVVSLVNNDILCGVAKIIDPYGNVPIRDSAGRITGWESANWGCTDHENVVRQLQAMHQLEKEHKWYRIAMNPWHARQIIEDGDLAVVVSMETDKPLSVAGGNKDGDWEKQLDFYRAMGLSSMQIVHESDSIFCGAAPHRDMMGALQMVHWPLKTITELFDGNKSNFDRDANGKNKLGVTPRGKLLVEAMKKRNMPIDLAHGSERCRRDVMAQVGTDYGLYDSHTKFGALLGGHVKAREEEFVVTDDMARDYEKHKVLVGLRTSSTDANDATNDVSPAKHVPNNCAGSARSYAQQLAYALKFPKLAIAYGTDYNTGVAQMGPRFGTGRCFASRKDLKDTVTRPMSDSEGDMPARSKTVQPIAGTNYYTHGLATYGWLPELTIDLVDNLQAPGAGALRRSAEAYLDMWERTYPPADAPPPVTTTNGTVALGGSCTKGDECESGRCTGVGGLKGACVCNEDPDCGTGRFCNAGFGTNSCVTKLADGQACKGDNQCASLGSKCSQWRPQDGQVSGICYKPESKSAGQSCVIDLECKTGKCNSNKTCVCNSDTDCSPSWCDQGLDAHENSCKPKLDNGQVCGHTGEFDLDRRCKSGKCKAQKLLSTTFTCQ